MGIRNSQRVHPCRQPGLPGRGTSRGPEEIVGWSALGCAQKCGAAVCFACTGGRNGRAVAGQCLRLRQCHLQGLRAIIGIGRRDRIVAGRQLRQVCPTLPIGPQERVGWRAGFRMKGDPSIRPTGAKRLLGRGAQQGSRMFSDNRRVRHRAAMCIGNRQLVVPCCKAG